MSDMKLSDQLQVDHDCGDFGRALEGYAERAKALEDQIGVYEAIKDVSLDKDLDKIRALERRVEELENGIRVFRHRGRRS